MYLNCTNMYPLGFNVVFYNIFEPGVCQVWIIWLIFYNIFEPGVCQVWIMWLIFYNIFEPGVCQVWIMWLIFYSNWTFYLCICTLYNCKTKTNQKFADFKKKLCQFSIFNGNWIYCRQIFLNLIMHKPSLGSCEVPYTFWARSVQPL